ncbi:MAG: helix-turn-helix transcriptional regulator [Verrucomicrobiales bacterium]|nr:helix-turn-helix transcriptional regulator [Verrucomicrobiales bacterium]
MQPDESSETSPTQTPPPPPPPPPPPLGSTKAIATALAEPIRWDSLRLLADGSYPAILDLAQLLNCAPDQMGRHLRWLLKAGLVRTVLAPGADRRCIYYQIHPAYRRTLPDGRREIDYGPFALRFPAPD